MKIFRVTEVYNEYGRLFKKKNEDKKIYAELIKEFYYDSFGWADFWENALTPLGYEVCEIPYNLICLQRMWAKENGINNYESISLEQIIIQQLKKYKPEVLWFDSTNATLLKEILTGVPGIKLVLGWTGSAIQDPRVYKQIDVLLSCAPESVEKLSQKGIKAYHFNHAFEPRILERLHNNKKKNNAIFSGQIVTENQFHNNRAKMLLELIDKCDLKIYTPQYNAFVKKEKPNFLNSVFGLDMFQALKDANIVVNIHADSSPYYASNMRLYEITGVGSCMITDWKKNLHDLFKEDTEIMTYKSTEECVDKIKWLLEHPIERELISKAGQKRTLMDHTFQQRAPRLIEIIENELKKNKIRD